MGAFRFARRSRPGFLLGLPACWPARRAGRGRRWLAAAAGACLVAVLAAWPAMLAGPHVHAASSTSAASTTNAASMTSGTVLTAMQARVLNPGPPTGLTAAPGNGQATVSWTAPVDDGGAAITGYYVFVGSTSGGESGTPVSGLVAGTSFTVTGLTNGSTYYFTAEAVNAADLVSAPSAQAQATLPIPVTAPGAPTGLAATAGDAQVSLSWTAPASDGGAAITGYDVYDGTTASFKDTTPVTTATGTSVTVPNLTNGTVYYFRVTAINQAGASAASGTASATPAATITAPGAPAGLTATAGQGKIVLSWTVPASDGGAKISGYDIYQGTSPGGESAAPANGPPVTATSYTVTGVTKGTTYYFKVAAVNAAKQQGKESGEASATPLSPSASASASASASVSPTAQASATLGPATSATAGAPGSPTGLSLTAGNAKVILSWTAPVSVGGSPVTGYNIYQGTSPNLSASTPVKNTTGTNITLTGLTNGTTYYFAVTAVGSNGAVGSSSNVVSAVPTGKVVLASHDVSEPVVVSLIAIAVLAIVGAVTLAVRGLRPRPPMGPPAEVRAVPEPGGPPLVTVHEYSADETYTVRLEPLPAAIITTIEAIEEIRS